jgi:formylglycine-generating enzyme
MICAFLSNQRTLAARDFCPALLYVGCLLAVFGFPGRAEADDSGMVLAIEIRNGSPQLSVSGPVGAVCSVQHASTLTPTATWHTLTNFLLANQNTIICDSQANPMRFYRVSQGPTNMSLVPAGTFQMGDAIGDSVSAGSSSESPVHPVFVSDFLIDKCEVSMDLWDSVRSITVAAGYAYDNPGIAKGRSHPVCKINWYDAVKWCNARSEAEGLEPVYYTDAACTQVYRAGQMTPHPKWSARGYRLPTEAQWEKAARGGAASRRFPWSDTDTITHERANYWSDSTVSYDLSPTRGFHPAADDGGAPFANPPYTVPTDYFAPQHSGMRDMAGNLTEWCWDWYSSIWYKNPGATANDTTGPTTGERPERVLRGGSWTSGPFYTRCSFRSSSDPRSSYYYVGLRCVRLP